MAKNETVKKSTIYDATYFRNEEYLGKVFTMLKKMEGVALTKTKSHFNNSEMRLLGEIILASYDGRRIISTQLADRLGVTRSAVSQMVNKLEMRGIVKRVADDVDRKIAYIEFSDDAIKYYDDEKNVCCELIGGIIDKLGIENLDKLIELSDLFIEAVNEVKE